MPRPRVSTVPPAADAAPAAKRRPGRPSPGDTVQVTLRIPRGQLAQLLEEGGRRSAAAGRTITAQAIILELIEARYPNSPAP